MTFSPGLEQNPALSPDGKTFLFVSGAAGNPDIYLQRVGGRNTINLTSDSSGADQRASSLTRRARGWC